MTTALRQTVSERAVLRAVEDGAITTGAIAAATGAASWWIELNVLALTGRGLLRNAGGVLSR